MAGSGRTKTSAPARRPTVPMVTLRGPIASAPAGLRPVGRQYVGSRQRRPRGPHPSLGHHGLRRPIATLSIDWPLVHRPL